MLINDLITPAEAAMAAGVPRFGGITMNEMAKGFTVSEASRIIYAPVILTNAAFGYMGGVFQYCSLLRLPYKKECREAREAIADYKHRTFGILEAKVYRILEEKMEEFFDGADEGLMGIWEAVKGGLSKKYTRLSSQELNLLCSATICSCLLLYVKQLEENNARFVQSRLMRPYNQSISIEGAKVLNFVGKVIDSYKVDNTDAIREAMILIATKVNDISTISEDEVKEEDREVDEGERYLEQFLQVQGSLPGDYRRTRLSLR